MTEPLLPDNDFALLTLLPEPSKAPCISRREYLTDIYSTLHSHFERDPDVLVGSNGYLCHDHTDPESFVKMDVVVAFGVIPRAIIGRNGYMMGEVGKPPEFVLEVVPSTLNDPDIMIGDVFGEFRPDDVRRDYDHVRNLEFYARYGVKEYWRLLAGEDPDPHQDRPLAGFRLDDGKYQPIPITQEPDGEMRGYSDSLDLYLCWKDNRLRCMKMSGGHYLPNFSEMAAQRDAAVKAWDAEKARRVEAEYRRFVAEERGRQLEEMVRSTRSNQTNGHA